MPIERIHHVGNWAVTDVGLRVRVRGMWLLDSIDYWFGGGSSLATLSADEGKQFVLGRIEAENRGPDAVSGPAYDEWTIFAPHATYEARHTFPRGVPFEYLHHERFGDLTMVTDAEIPAGTATAYWTAFYVDVQPDWNYILGWQGDIDGGADAGTYWQP